MLFPTGKTLILPELKPCLSLAKSNVAMNYKNLRQARAAKKQKQQARYKRAANFVSYAKYTALQKQLEQAQIRVRQQTLELSSHNTPQYIFSQAIEHINDAKQLAEF